MKTIGFIDYYLSEWHANNYPKWIKELNEQTGDEFVVKYAWGEKESEVDGLTSEQWCEKFGVENCSSIAEVCQKADYIIILAPSNPEKHLEYAKEALRFQKRTYIDKTFAPDYKTAKEIFDLGEKYNTAFFSTSALRYATELDELKDVTSLITTGGGSSIEEYGIHQIEMAVKVLSEKPVKIKVEGQGKAQYIVSVEFENGKNAKFVFAPAYGFSVCAENAEGECIYKGIASSFFKFLLKDIIKFFNTGIIPFDSTQTLDVMKIREGIIFGLQKQGEWLAI